MTFKSTQTVLVFCFFLVVTGMLSCEKVKYIYEAKKCEEPVKVVVPDSSLQVLFTETFDAGTLGSKPWINLQPGNENYAAIINGALRHNLMTDRVGNDPISGKKASGLYSHTFLASNYYRVDTIGAVTLEMKFRFDDSYWKNTAGTATYPLAAGKMFLSDAVEDSNGPYLALTNSGTNVTITANNGSALFNNWTSRPYGWKNANGTARINMYLQVANPLFRTDGVWRTLTMEVQYNPGNVGYNKGRLKADGMVLTDTNAFSNTDSLGWFNLPIEYKLKGFRAYASSVDITTASEDHGTHPANYTGYAGGFEIDKYTLYRGYKN